MKNSKALLLFTLLWSLGCSSAEAIRTPQYRLGVRDALSLSDMRLCVQAGVLAAGWNIEAERGTSILATLQAKDSWAKVIIEYRPDAYRILHYKTHPGLRHEDGHISWRYNGWVDRLDSFLRQSVARAMSEKAAARVAQPPAGIPPASNERPPQTMPMPQPVPMPEVGADNGMSDAPPESGGVAQDFDTEAPEPFESTD